MYSDMERGDFPRKMMQKSFNVNDQQSSQAAQMNNSTAFKRTSQSLQPANFSKIKVCVRVRPLLPHEQSKDEVVYFPSEPQPSGLQVSG